MVIQRLKYLKKWIFVRIVGTMVLLLTGLIGAAAVLGHMLPAGNVISYSSSPDSYQVRMQIYWLDVNRNLPLYITSFNTSACCPRLSPDQSSIAIVLPVNSYNEEIFVIDAASDQWRQLTGYRTVGREPIWWAGRRESALTWTGLGGGEWYVTDWDGGKPLSVIAQDAYGDNPIWSPDGSQIAFESNRDNDWEIYVMDADLGNQRRLTTSFGWDRSPVWSPDGSQIAFVSQRDGNWEIYVMNADGSNQRRLSVDGGTSPAWSPDGRFIAYEAESSPYYWSTLYVMNADGTNHHAVTEPGSDARWPNWSPDSSQIVFVSQRDGNQEIYVVDATGENLRRLTVNTINDYSPSWLQ